MVIEFIDRKTGKKKQEDVPAGGMMRFLYGTWAGKASLHTLFKRKFISSWGGNYMNSKKSVKKIDPFIEQYGIDLNEFIVPKNGFKHFNDFFYRKIKPEARPIESGITSPADGRVLAFNKISDTQKFFIKGTEFNLEQFIQNKDLAKKYQGGSMFIVRLAPVDYHRYHFPVDGEATENNKINGDYFSVSPIALRKSLKIFLENKREFCLIKNQQLGDVLFMDVGATMTGSIIQTYTPNTEIKKGDEKGYFAFGGSTVVLLFEPYKIEFSNDLIENTLNGYETYIKMGETIASPINN